VLSDSRIIANAYGGNGGNIRIVADHFLASLDSVVQASSQLGIDGTVVIDSPDTDLSGTVTVLSANYLEDQALVQDFCAARAAGQASTFVVGGRGGLPLEPGDWLPSPGPADPSAQRPEEEPTHAP
jgi:large exoprotein involved in heme utilization and adhesion